MHRHILALAGRRDVDSVGANELAARFQAAREDPMLAVLEGFHAVKHALRFGAELLEVAAADPREVAELAARLAPDLGSEFARRLETVDAETFAALSPTPPATRVAALARRPRDSVARLLSGPGPGPVVVLDAPRHLGNVGAAIRVAAAASAEAVAVTGEADPWHPAAIRGAAGLQFALPVGRLESARQIARPIVSFDPAGEPLRPEAVPRGAVLAFGSERAGLGPDLAAMATLRVALPMRPGVSSLNLATAVAAALYGLRLTG
jgi:TrmH family RNA methyltransferase